MLKDKAYAKINAALNIKGVREDGYHELEMLNLPVDYYDTVRMIESPEMDVFSNIDLPANNSLIKAVECAREVFGFTQNFTIVLEKNIPFESGLGGGTADAASVLRLLREHFHLEDREEDFLKIAAKVGADVPFQYVNRPCITEGIGEKLEPVRLRHLYWVLLVKPNSGVSTPKAFAKYDEIGGSHPDVRKLAEAMESGNLAGIAATRGNSLEEAAFTLNRQIEPILHEMRRMGLEASGMSGSGSTVFAIHDDKRVLDMAKKMFEKRFNFTAVCRILV